MINMKTRLKPGSLAKTLIVALALLVPSIAQAAGWGLWVDRGYGFRFEGRFERFENCDNAARMQAQAQARAGCTEMEEGGSPNTAVIRFTPGQPIYVNVRVNGRVPARLVLDTGADSTVIRPDVLRVADASGPKGTARMRGVTGQEVSVDVYHVTSLEVGPARVDALSVLSYDIAYPGSDGLLGRDFLGLFTVTIDHAVGRATLSPRR